jgi:hypothetical protein
MFFVPWSTIHESNPQEILERREPITKVPFVIMQGALDDNILPAAQENSRRHIGPPAETFSFSCSKTVKREWVAQEGPQADRAREMVKAFIARNVNGS